ncbi:hypothetical protein DOTSEDRAFT_28299 [Dothistroma septosporum NZE10]|uniref:ABC transporter-like protein n=1 Tax=Dothistroma septosporum (strain NZE10 / CBS 128990) TaxID=675120 RepID=M2YJK7_DOTSN|nr:hypothetical protein DOTSEDRAFT_28299 [Dothistroma septosporum NZE10]
MYRTRTSIPAATISFLASLSLLYLSGIEHAKSVRPSTLINLWVLFSLILDLPQTRTLWLRPGTRALPAIFTVGVSAKAVVLYLEARSKRRSLVPAYRLYAPEALVNLYDRTALWWLNPLFWIGYNGHLSTEKLFAVDAALAAEQVQNSFEAAWATHSNRRRRRGVLAVFESFKLDFLAIIVPRLCLSALKLCQPLLIARITTILSSGSADSGNQYGRGLIGAAALIYAGLAVTKALYQRQLHRLITKLRGSVIAAVYAKMLRLDSTKLSDNAALTLVTADVTRMCNSLKNVDELFATPIEIGIAIYLLERQIGVSCIAPVAISLAITIVSFIKSNAAVPMQKGWLKAVSDRVAMTSSVLGFPKAFKMLGLTEHFTDKIQTMRILELEKYAVVRKYITWRNVYSIIPVAMAPPLTLLMFTLLHGQRALDPTTAFTSLALVSLLTSPIQELNYAVPQFQTAIASLDRVQDFLLLPEETYTTPTSIQRNDRSVDTAPAESDEPTAVRARPKGEADTSIVLSLACASVVLGPDQHQVLHDIDINLRRSQVSLLMGPVGSGKSVLLKTILGDLPLAAGQRTSCSRFDSMAFCAQDPWLPNNTVRQLIIGQSEFDSAWYDTVVSACASTVDIASLPQGDNTLIGTKGVSLSGGQRQRLALARALYSRKELLIADDVLSGLDANTALQIFSRVFGPRGICKANGTTVILATHTAHFLAEVDHIIALGDGVVVEQGTLQELNAKRGYVHDIAVGTRRLSSSDEDDITPDERSRPTSLDKVDIVGQDLSRRIGDPAVYAYYLKSIGWKIGILLALTIVGFGFGTKFPDLWVKWWSEAGASDNHRHSLAYWVGLLFFFASISVLSCGAHIWTMLVCAVPRSSAKLHKQLLRVAMRATYNFFVNTDAGVTLNRFSNDMSLIETELAAATLQFTDGAAALLFSAALIVAGADYAAATLPFVLAALYCIQKFYLRTSRQLRFLELEAQAPLLTHCSETLAGVTTIRAFGWQHQSHRRLMELLDESQRPYYLLLCVQRWLDLVLSLVTAALAVVVVSMAMLLPQTASAGSIGLSLLGILSFTFYVTFVVQAWTNLETSLGAVARCKNFEATTPGEDGPAEVQAVPDGWPAAGKVVIKDLRAAYNENDQDVLQSVSLCAAAGEKIGICGRSGSGKSSLLLTLFRLLDYSSGSIEIDGIDLSTIPRHKIRESFTALPQEAITFPGSVLANLDPLGKSTQDEVENVLGKVGLLDIITSRGGLEADMTTMSLSQGQLQLFAVARALLRRSKLMVLDEISSSVDSATEEMMVKLIKEEFAESTIIAVAHRLKTIVDFDTVVVMDAGRVVEIGKPGELLRRSEGWFRGMWERMVPTRLMGLWMLMQVLLKTVLEAHTTALHFLTWFYHQQKYDIDSQTPSSATVPLGNQTAECTVSIPSTTDGSSLRTDFTHRVTAATHQIAYDITQDHRATLMDTLAGDQHIRHDTPETPPTPHRDMLSVYLRGPGKVFHNVKLDPEACMDSIMKSYASRVEMKGLDVRGLVFELNGVRFGGKATPRSLGMRDGDTVVVCQGS